MQVFSIITILVFLNFNKNNNNTCFQFTQNYIFSVYKTYVIDIFLQRRHGHCWVDQDLILLLRALSDVKFLNFMGIRFHIYGPYDDKVSDPYIKVFTFLRWNSDLSLVLKDLVFNLKTSVIISRSRLCSTLNIWIPKFCRFIWCIVTELLFFNSLAKEERNNCRQDAMLFPEVC